MDTLSLFALSGSLRKYSYNNAALHALRMLAPGSVHIKIGTIDNLPLFNPDREGERIESLITLKDGLSHASGLIIASPEYAHGISGAMKNALDWLVSAAEFPNMPIMLINTSPRAHHAQDALREVLTTMSGIIVDSAFVEIPLLGSDLDAQGIVDNPDMSTTLTTGLRNFCESVVALNSIAIA